MRALAPDSPLVGPSTFRGVSLLDGVRWELTKLVALARVRWALLFCLVAPVIVVFIIDGQQRPPKDSLFGRYIHDSGFAVALLVLGFAAQWVLPLLTSIVAGDIFASEDQHGTWKTVLTRSASRQQLFWAKTLTALAFALATLFVMGASTIIASVVIAGHQDLTGLTGQSIPSGRAARLVIEAWATAIAPVIGFTCLAILLSIRSRNPAVGIAAPVVLGMVMQLGGTLGGAETSRPFLLTTPFETWHGLFTEPQFTRPLLIGLLASGIWSVASWAKY